MSAWSEMALWALFLLPAVVGGVLTLTPRAERAAASVAVGTATVTGVLAGVVAWQRPAVSAPFMAGVDFALGADALSALVACTIAGVTLLVLVFSAGEIREGRARYNGLILLFAAAALVTATAQTLLSLLFAWEVMGATSFALIGFWWRDEDRVAAGLTAFVATRTADLGLYAAAGAALAGGAGLALADLPQASDGWRDVVAGGVLVAALGKAAQLPFSFWLSRAMAGPSPVSALLHSAAMVAMGGYLLLRTVPLLESTGWAATTAAWTGAFTALILGVVAYAQPDLKQLLAASTSAQLGFVVMAAGVASVGGGAAHLVAHASTKALLFLAAGAWLTAFGTKQLAALRGVARRSRVTGWAATIGALSLAGIAPLSLWATKDAVLAAALKESVWLYVIGLAAAATSAAYAGKILVVAWDRSGDVATDGADRGNGAEGSGSVAELEQEPTGHIGVLEQVPLVLLALGAATLGLLVLAPVGRSVTPVAAELVVSAVLALAVVAAVWRGIVPEPRWAREWLGLERAAHIVAVRPTMVLATALARFDDRVLDRVVVGAASTILVAARRAARFDDRVLDGGVEATSRATWHVAARAARDDDRWVDGAVEGIATLVRRLGQHARRPQTGQLHQYYVQAFAVLAVGVLLLITVR